MSDSRNREKLRVAQNRGKGRVREGLGLSSGTNGDPSEGRAQKRKEKIDT